MEEKNKSLNPVKVRLLERAAQIYQESLPDNPEALAFLERRGIGSPEIISEFRIGYSSGKIPEMISPDSEEMKLLDELGIVRRIKNRFGSDSFFEYFKGFVVFPVTDEEGNIVEMYARAVSDDAKSKHRATKGEHLGVWNAKAFKTFDEIILTKSILDGLSLYRLGFPNVTASFGPDGFLENHLRLMEANNTRKLFIAYDNDKSGKYFTRLLTGKLKEAGFMNIVPVELPEGVHDVNDFLLAGGTKENFLELMNGRKVVLSPEEPQEVILQEVIPEAMPQAEIIEVIPLKELPGGDLEFKAEGFIYRLRGIKEDFETNLRAGIRVSAENRSDQLYDSINLYSAKSRASFAATVASRFSVASETVLSHLETILSKLEEKHDREVMIKAGEADKIELSDEERRIGLSFLKSGNILEEVKHDLSTVGYIGEEANKALVYLIAASRKMDEPLAGVIVSRSSGGKSKLVDTVKKLVPEEETLSISSASDTALYYETDLSHKFVSLSESAGNGNIEYPLRELISSKEITRIVTMKDEKTGQMKSTKITAKGPIAYIETASSAESLNPENLNRCLVLFVDETPEQTKRILEYQRFLETPAGFLTRRKIPGIVEKHKLAQKLLSPVLVINPFADFMDFPERKIEARRDQLKFIRAISAVAFLHQYQREKKTIRDGESGLVYEYIEPTIEDYRTTYRLLVESGILSNTLSDIPKTARDLYEIIRSMVLTISEMEKRKAKDVLFTRRDIWEFSGWSNSQVRKCTEILLDFEFLEIAAGGIKGQKHSYSVVLETELERLMLEMIPTPEEIKKRIENKKP